MFNRAMHRRYKVFIEEGNNFLPIGSADTVEEAKDQAMKCVDDALPQNTVAVFDTIGKGYLRGDGESAWSDRKEG